MKKYFAMLMLLALAATADVADAQRKSPCLFDGTVNGVKVRSFEGSIDHRAGPSYLVLSLKINNMFWMMDLTGVTKKPGRADFTLVLKKHDGRKFSEHYSASGSHNVIQNKKVPSQFGIFNAAFSARDRGGKTVPVSGNFVWDATGFPK